MSLEQNRIMKSYYAQEEVWGPILQNAFRILNDKKSSMNLNHSQRIQRLTRYPQAYTLSNHRYVGHMAKAPTWRERQMTQARLD